jgi:hypothetical protein
MANRRKYRDNSFTSNRRAGAQNPNDARWERQPAAARKNCVKSIILDDLYRQLLDGAVSLMMVRSCDIQKCDDTVVIAPRAEFKQPKVEGNADDVAAWRTWKWGSSVLRVAVRDDCVEVGKYIGAWGNPNELSVIHFSDVDFYDKVWAAVRTHFNTVVVLTVSVFWASTQVM